LLRLTFEVQKKINNIFILYLYTYKNKFIIPTNKNPSVNKASVIDNPKTSSYEIPSNTSLPVVTSLPGSLPA